MKSKSIESISPLQAPSSSLGSVDYARMTVTFAIGLCIVSALAMTIDQRTVDGALNWVKPIKFSLSIVIHMASLVLFLHLIPKEAREQNGVRWPMILSLWASIIELSYIFFQAARGRRSHFNEDSLLEQVVYMGVMGPLAVLLVVSSFLIGRRILRHAPSSQHPGFAFGAGWGLLSGSALTLVVASIMSSGQIDGPGHWVGGEHSDANGLAFLGWSRTGGDLRISHFFANHMMQIVPLIGWLADSLRVKNPKRWVWSAMAVCSFIVVGTFVWALMGRPLLPALL